MSKSWARKRWGRLVIATVALVAALGLGTISRSTGTPPQEVLVQAPGQVGKFVQNVVPAGTLNDPSDSQYDEFLERPTGPQISLTRLSDGQHMGNANERLPRPALSLIKLYLAEYVIQHGTDEEKDRALEMIRASSDEDAEILTAAYPDAVQEIAAQYGLEATHPSDEGWGFAETSMYDVVKFVTTKLREDPHSPVLQAMREVHPVADDGTEQNFGTATLPGVQGSKFGWSDDGELHSSVSFGADFVVAVAVTGSAEDLTAFVQSRVRPVI